MFRFLSRTLGFSSEPAVPEVSTAPSSAGHFSVGAFDVELQQLAQLQTNDRLMVYEWLLEKCILFIDDSHDVAERNLMAVWQHVSDYETQAYDPQVEAWRDSVKMRLRIEDRLRQYQESQARSSERPPYRQSVEHAIGRGLRLNSSSLTQRITQKRPTSPEGKDFDDTIHKRQPKKRRGSLPSDMWIWPHTKIRESVHCHQAPVISRDDTFPVVDVESSNEWSARVDATLKTLNNHYALPSTDPTGASSTLAPGQWISGTVIDHCISLLSTCLEDSTIRLFSNMVVDSTQNLRPLDSRVETILVPIHHQSQHWTLCRLELAEKNVYHFDSLLQNATVGKSTWQRVKDLLGRMRIDADGWNFVSVGSCPQQTNDFDCGIHVIVKLFYEACGLTSPNDYDCALWRKLIQATILPDSHAELMNTQGQRSTNVSSGVSMASQDFTVQPVHPLSRHALSDVSSALTVLAAFEDLADNRLSQVVPSHTELQRDVVAVQRYIEMLEAIPMSLSSTEALAKLLNTHHGTVKNEIERSQQRLAVVLRCKRSLRAAQVTGNYVL